MYVGIVGCSLIIQSCEKEIFEQSLETDELYNSEEFREYLYANIDLFNEYKKKTHNKTIAVKGKNGTLVLSTKNVRISLVSTYSIDSKLLINLASKREQLIAKYPSYINFIEKGKKLAIKETILSSENLSKRLLGKNNIITVPLKSKKVL